MLNLIQDIQSLTDFKRKTLQFIEQMKQSGNPLILTVNGRAEIVVQDAQSYQELLDRVARAEEVAAIRKGMEEFERGEGRPAREALERRGSRNQPSHTAKYESPIHRRDAEERRGFAEKENEFLAEKTRN